MMKKSLIALAVLAASPVAFAATSNVDVYGQARIAYVDNNVSTNKSGLADQVSRIGLKGSEDLGGGMSAVYGFELGLVLTDSNNTTQATANGDGETFASRNKFVGLKGAFGTVLAGTHDTPYKLAGSADVFGDTAADATTGNDSTAGKNMGIIGRKGAASFDLRAAQALAYVSPDWNGFHFAAAVTNNGGDTDGNIGQTIALDSAKSLALVYVNGPLSVKYGYEDHDKLADESAQKVTVAYKMGDIGLAATYEAQDLAATSDDRTAYLVSATYAMGPITLAAQTGKAKKDTSGTELERTTIGATYNLSKRTSTYIAYNKDDAGAAAGDGDADAKTWTIGVNHSF